MKQERSFEELIAFLRTAMTPDMEKVSEMLAEEFPALGDLHKSFTWGYTTQEVSQALALPQPASMGDSSDGIQPSGYGDLE